MKRGVTGLPDNRIRFNGGNCLQRKGYVYYER